MQLTCCHATIVRLKLLEEVGLVAAGNQGTHRAVQKMRLSLWLHHILKLGVRRTPGTIAYLASFLKGPEMSYSEVASLEALNILY